MTVLTTLARAARGTAGPRTVTRAGRLATSALVGLGVEPVGVVPMRDGTILELDARSRTEAGAFWTGEYESDYRDALVQLAHAIGPTLHDVGANVGLLAVPVARQVAALAGAEVVCFEPVGENVVRLQANIRRNGLSNCAVHACALGDAVGQIELARESRRGASSGNAIIVSGSDTPTGYDAVRAAVLERLDDLVGSGRVPAPDVIKLDVEGSEVGFLRGAAHTLERYRPVVVGEFHSGFMPRFGTTFLDAADALPERYAVFSFAADRRLVRVRPAVGLGDVLLVPEEKVAALRPYWRVED